VAEVAGAAAAVVAAVADSVVAAVAGLVAAEVAASASAAVVAAAAVAAGSVASGSEAAGLGLGLAGVAADPGERAACAKSHEKRRCDGRRITSGLAQQSDKLGVGRHFAKVHKSSLLTASTYRLHSLTH
jgi:hypothetical protein